MNLSERMLAAADTIEELNPLYGFNPGAPWSPRALRNEAPVVEAEDREAAEADQ